MVTEAPADGVMRATTIIGAQAFHTVNVIDEGGGPDLDDYGPIALGPIAGNPYEGQRVNMAFKLASRTREQTTTTGTGTIQLGGLLHPTERLFIDAIGDGNQTSYVILSGDGTSVEEGIGSVAAGSPPTLARRVLRSTNGDALVALTGTSTVYCADVPNITPAAGPTWHAAIAVARPERCPLAPMPTA